MEEQEKEDAPDVARGRERRLLDRAAPWAVILSGIGTIVIAMVAVINLVR